MSKENYSLKSILSRMGKDIKNNKAAIIIIAAYFAFQRFFLQNACPLVRTTGFPCPACGLTRAGVALLKGQFGEAWKIHPFIYPVAGLIIAFVITRYIRGKKTDNFVKYLAILLIALIAYYVYRMIRYFPGESPMSYYYDNVLRHLMEHLGRK